MTLRHPMFPRVADRVKTSDREVLIGTAPDPFLRTAALQDGSLYVKTDIAPETLFQALGRLRSEAEAEIERLMAFLDEIDGDPDSEPAGDEAEAALAAPENHPNNHGLRYGAKPCRDDSGSQIDWCGGSEDDREGDAGCDDREGDELAHGGESEREDYELSGDEDEPWLGSFDRLSNQDHAWRQTAGNNRTWCAHFNNDAEVDQAERG